MTDRQPHVRTETRTVYVFGKSSRRMTKAKAYRDAARAIVMKECNCDHGCEADGYAQTRCRFHTDCACDGNDAYGYTLCHWHMKLPRHKRGSVGRGGVYYVTVRDRLARFLRFVDAGLA
jgi:hypothetical protein